nr:uncharacterized protein LOC113398301 [Vanessa tameamea]
MDKRFKDLTVVNILQWNAQSIESKLVNFGELLWQEKIHIAIVSETWLRKESSITLSGYNIYRNDREDSYGGVAIIVHKSIQSLCLKKKDTSPGEDSITYSMIYHLPELGFRKAHSCLDSLSRLVSYIQIGYSTNSPTLACFIDIENAYNNVNVHHVVSMLDEIKVGCGAAFYDARRSYSRGFRIKNNVISIMSVELIAILEALSYATDLNDNNIVILSDSKSGLQHIMKCAHGSRGVPIAYYILYKIYYLLKKGITLRLQWIPSHIGLKGNEEVDKIAKHAVITGTDIEVKPYYSEYLKVVRSRCFETWKKYMEVRSTEKGIWYKTIQNVPPHKPWFENCELSKLYITIGLRCRSGHIPSKKFAYLMRKVESPNCEYCNKVEDLYHILTECAKNRIERATTITKLNMNLLDIGVFQSILTEPATFSAKTIYDIVLAHMQPL